MSRAPLSKKRIKHLLACALRDGMEYQDTVMDAHSHMKDDPEYARAHEKHEDYREVLRIMHEDPRSITEMLRDEMANWKQVPLNKLMHAPENTTFQSTPVRKRKRPA